MIRLDLRDAIGSVLADGAAFVPRAVDAALVERVQHEIVGGPFEPAPEAVGPVRQRTEAYTIERLGGALAELAEELVRSVRATGVRGLATWRPTEAAVQRYRPGPLGITPHLDGKRFRRLVAVVTTNGRASFSIHSTRDGGSLREWDTGPGDLVLIRGPGLSGARDGRPFHAIAAPNDGVRYSVGFRMRAQ